MTIDEALSEEIYRICERDWHPLTYFRITPGYPSLDYYDRSWQEARHNPTPRALDREKNELSTYIAYTGALDPLDTHPLPRKRH